MIKKPIFCANCQKEVEHLIEVVEQKIQATCDCGRVLHFPHIKKANQFRELLDLHKLSNIGQVTAKEPKAPDPELLKAIEEA